MQDVHVSVPLRGTTFLNLKQIVCKHENLVSVPLRGTTFLNRCRSPGGDCVMSFRPLTGNYISQLGRRKFSSG